LHDARIAVTGESDRLIVKPESYKFACDFNIDNRYAEETLGQIGQRHQLHEPRGADQIVKITAKMSLEVLGVLGLEVAVAGGSHDLAGVAGVCLGPG
jgi:hypothetical protein